MLVADGLFAFLTEPVITGIFRKITAHFESGELTFNDYGRIGWVSKAALKFFPAKMFKDVGSQWGYRDSRMRTIRKRGIRGCGSSRSQASPTSRRSTSFPACCRSQRAPRD